MQKIVINLLTLALIGGAFYMVHLQKDATRVDPMMAEFESWAQANGKLYGSEDEKSYRFGVFKANHQMIDAHNAQGKNFFLTINKFADLTNEEFKAKYLTLKAVSTPSNVVALPVGSLPASVDWRTKGVVTPVKDQGQCGSCWAFSTVAALEGLYAQTNGKLLSFSEQQLVDCSSAQGNEGCNGGLMDNGFTYTAINGLELESEYPYEAVDQDCAEDTSKDVKINSGHQDVPANDVNALKSALAQQVVSVAVEADTDFQFYGGGIVNDEDCGTQLDHGVTAVGYGTESGQEYFIVKNSWGASWGENGYIRIATKSSNPAGICGILSAASYPTA